MGKEATEFMEGSAGPPGGVASAAGWRMLVTQASQEEGSKSECLKA